MSPRQAPRRRLASVIAFLVGVGLATGLLIASAAHSPGSGLGGSTAGGGWTCVHGAGSSCVLEATGSNSALGPVSSWCNATYSYAGGNPSGVTWDCQPTPLDLGFNETLGSTLSGTFSVTGPFQLWILPTAQVCDLVG
jgi:hypothetical protein